jgi:hypothetical protein
LAPWKNTSKTGDGNVKRRGMEKEYGRKEVRREWYERKEGKRETGVKGLKRNK